MALADNLRTLAAALDTFAAAANRTITLQIETDAAGGLGAAMDRSLADLIQRGQATELLRALKAKVE